MSPTEKSAELITLMVIYFADGHGSVSLRLMMMIIWCRICRICISLVTWYHKHKRQNFLPVTQILLVLKGVHLLARLG